MRQESRGNASNALELLSIYLGKMLVAASLASPGIWIAELRARHKISLMAIGSIGSAEIAACALGAIFTALTVTRINPRTMVLVAIGLVGLGNVIAASDSSTTIFVVGRVLTGFGVGLLNASVIGIVARKSNCLSIFAIGAGLVVATQGLVHFMLPLFLGHGGLTRLFMLTAFMAFICLMISRVGFSKLEPVRIVASVAGASSGRSTLLPGLISCCALAIMSVGVGTMDNFNIVIAGELGFGPAAIGSALGIAGPAAFLGPLAAHRIGDRFGVLKPLLAAIAVLVGCWLTFVNMTSLLALGACLCLASACIGTTNPYSYTFLSRMDPTGRLASATPAFIYLGMALGPLVGGVAMSEFGFRSVAVAASAFALAGSLVLISVGVRGRRPVTYSQLGNR